MLVVQHHHVGEVGSGIHKGAARFPRAHLLLSQHSSGECLWSKLALLSPLCLLSTIKQNCPWLLQLLAICSICFLFWVAIGFMLCYLTWNKWCSAFGRQRSKQRESLHPRGSLVCLSWMQLVILLEFIKFTSRVLTDHKACPQMTWHNSTRQGKFCWSMSNQLAAGCFFIRD